MGSQFWVPPESGTGRFGVRRSVWWLPVVWLLPAMAVAAQPDAVPADAPEGPTAAAAVDPLKAAIKTLRELQRLEVEDEAAYNARSLDELPRLLPVFEPLSRDETDPQRQLTAQLYLIDVLRALGRTEAEQAAIERYFALALPPQDPGNRSLAAWSAVTTFAQHRLFRGLRVVSRRGRWWAEGEDAPFDEDLVRQAAQAYERFAAWAGQTDLAGKALDKAAWVYYACLNDYDTAMPLCQRIGQQWPRSEYHLRAEWRLGMMYYCMGEYRRRNDDEPFERPEDVVAAKGHFETIVGKWPDSTEAHFAGGALLRMRIGVEGAIPVGFGTE